MGYNLNVDIDNESKLSLAVQGKLIPTWVYENSQTAHESKRIRLAEIQRQVINEDQQQLKRQRQRVQRQQTQNEQRQEQINQQPRQYNRKINDIEPGY
ncbi:hypothetical protein H5W18_06540 [Lactobacillus sp. Marseille-P7033]|nr:hypothetical protein [Lactobacillus sp. Marseille-P7033]NGC78326.1 hypothetical protein [Limosilactobacillus reuteri]